MANLGAQQKKKICSRQLVVSLVCATLMSLCTNSAAAQNLDSLWSIWQDQTAADSTRANSLLNYSVKKFLYSNLDSSLRYGHELLRFCQGRNIDAQTAKACTMLGQCMTSAGLPDSAIYYFKESLRYHRKNGNKIGIAGGHINIGTIYSSLGQGDSAIARYNMGIEICNEIGEITFKLNGLNNLGVIYLDRGEIKKAIPVFEEVVKAAAANKRGSEAHQGGLVNLGYCLAKAGNYALAIDRYNECLELVDEFGGKQVAVYVYNFLGDAYSELGEKENALIYLWKAHEFSKQEGDKAGMAIPLSNIADIYVDQGDRTRARELYESAYKLNLSIEHYVGALQSLGSLANLDLEENLLDSAEVRFKRGLRFSRDYNQSDQEAHMLAGLGRVALQQDKYKDAISFLSQAKRIGEDLNQPEIVSESARYLYEAYDGMGDYKNALKNFEEHIMLRDSIQRDENKRAAIQQEFRYSYNKQALADSLEFAKKESVKNLEIAERDANLFKQRIGLGAASGGLFLLGLLAYSIRRGKRRSDELLHNILPAEVATELKQKGHSDAHLFEETTVLFTDFKGFTGLAETLSPQQLVRDLNHCFSEFDKITTKYGIEKIKTIGDAYMAAGGLPTPNSTHAVDVVRAALEMVKFIEDTRIKRLAEGSPYFEIRVGVHTGPVVAGIVGVKKFQYDIWGDTVNTASRMESSGVAGKVNISGSTYAVLKDDASFTFESRGKIEAKGKGEIEMYFVSLKNE